jgi:serine/threonine protein phosphatase PrpC
MAKGPVVSIGQHSMAGRKSSNDDSYGVLIPANTQLETKGIAMAIADGMSSSEAAKVASETCVKSFLEDYYATHDSWTVKTSVTRVLTAINRWLHSQSETHYLSDRGMICTFSGAVLKSACAHIFHAGDSRIYLVRNGTIEQLTTDHRVRVARNQEYLSRAFGINSALEVDYRAVPVMAGDILLFTTDGVHDYARDSQMLDILRNTSDGLASAAQNIVQAAYANESPDNLTCQLVRIDEPGAPDEATHLRELSALPFPPELAPGVIFDGFKILREMHASKRTQVYLAIDQESGEKVVLKTPSVNYEDDPAYIEMFTREEWIGGLVASPHVLKVLRPARPRRALYYLTEYVEGQTLRQWMHDHPRPDLPTVRNIVEQIAKGLRAFHRKEVIHRDLKPENILIDHHNIVRIIDFGSVRVAGIEEIVSSIERPALVGTMDYAAPEYLRGELPTNRSDIYSLGVITYEMLTGKLPYQSQSFGSKRAAGRQSYTPATVYNDAIPPWVDAALEKAVHQSPVQRYDALSAFMEDMSRPNTAFEPRQARPLLERNPVAFWRGIAIALLLLNLGLLYWLSR